MNNLSATNQRVSLNDIGRLKKEKLQEIQKQKETIAQTTRELFAPITPTVSKVDGIMRSFNTGMAVFDGIMLGFKAMRSIRHFFFKRRQ